VSEYGVDRKKIIRPFWPGVDYQKQNYEGRVVVDNPPFSILSKIIKFYEERNIKYFLFCNAMTSFSIKSGCHIVIDTPIVYENGAKVSTGFITNLDDMEARTAPDLDAAIRNEAKKHKQTKTLPKYVYPDCVLTVAELRLLSKYGINFCVNKSESVPVRVLDSQRMIKKTIFGSGRFISEKAAAEKAAAEKAAAEKAAAEKAAAEKAAAEKAAAHVLELSEREKEIIKKLGGA
jgi:hypothetical protein